MRRQLIRSEPQTLASHTATSTSTMRHFLRHAFVVALSLSALSFKQGPTVTQGMPAFPVGAACLGKISEARLELQPRVSVSAHIRMVNKEVQLVYDLIDATEGVSIDHAPLTINVRYWPTTAHLASPTELYVAGKAVNGSTVISRYTLSLPVLGLSYDPGTGQSSEFVTAGQVVSSARLLQEAVVGRDVIQALGSVAGGSERVLLMQYADSRELWTLGVTSLQHSSVASPSPPAGGLGDSVLDAHYNVVGASVDDAFGYLYLFEDCFTGPRDEQHTFCIVYDADKDGVIDGYLSGTVADWFSLGLGDSSPI